MKGPAGEVIPPRVIDKPPSAELRPDQKDEDSLPPYAVLDDILEGLVEKEESVAEIVDRGHDRETVKQRRAAALPVGIQALPVGARGSADATGRSGSTAAIRIVNRLRDPT